MPFSKQDVIDMLQRGSVDVIQVDYANSVVVPVERTECRLNTGVIFVTIIDRKMQVAYNRYFEDKLAERKAATEE